MSKMSVAEFRNSAGQKLPDIFGISCRYNPETRENPVTFDFSSRVKVIARNDGVCPESHVNQRWMSDHVYPQARREAQLVGQCNRLLTLYAEAGNEPHEALRAQIQKTLEETPAGLREKVDEYMMPRQFMEQFLQ